MDPLMIQRIQIIKKQQFLNKFILYSFAALTCSLFCSTPFWYPPLHTAFHVFLYVSLPKIASLFFSTKVLFIIGNLIVIFLVGESKFFTSDSSRSSNAHHDECVYESRSLQNLHSLEDNKFEEKMKSSGSSSYKEGNWKEEIKGVEKEIEGERLILAAQRLSKKADDFIARVNKQRRIEAFLFSSTSD